MKAPNRRRIRLVVLCAVLLLLPGAHQTHAQSKGAPVPVMDTPHSSYINSIAFAPDGKWLATSSITDRTIKIWETTSGRLLRTIIGHKSPVNSVTVSPDGRWLASSSSDGSIGSSSSDGAVKIWDPATGALLRAFSHKIQHTKMNMAAWQTVATHDARTALTLLMWGGVVRWDIKSGAESKTIEVSPDAGTSPRAFALSPDERLIVTGNFEGKDSYASITVSDMTSGKVVRVIRAHRKYINSIAISPNGRWIASGSSDGTVKLWDLATGQSLLNLDSGTKGINSVAFSPDSRWIAAAGWGPMITIWDATSGQIQRTFEADRSVVGAVAFSPDGQSIAGGTTEVVKLWDTNSGNLIRTFPATSASSASSPSSYKYLYSRVSVASAPENRWVINSPAGLAIWDAGIGQPVSSFQKAPGLSNVILNGISAISVDKRGHWLLPIGIKLESGGAVGFWDVTDAQLLKSFKWSGADDEFINGAAASLDGRLVALSTYRTGASNEETKERYGKLKLFDIDAGQIDGGPVANVCAEGWEQGPEAVFSPDRKFIAVFHNKLLRVCDVASGKSVYQTQTKSSIQAINYSTDGRSIIILDGNELEPKSFRWFYNFQRIDIASGRTLWSTKKYSDNFPDRIIAVSPNARWIAMAEFSAVTILWDAASGKQIRTLNGNPGSPYTIAFSQDSGSVAVGNLNGTSALWNVETGELLTTTAYAQSGDWVTITPEGFFAASEHGAELLHVVRAFETIGIDQFYQSLYRPDLVREKRAGDPQGLVRAAAARLDLTKVLASGDAPTLTLVSPRDRDRATAAQINAEVEIVNRDGGLGRVEWRVNGVTVGVDTAPTTPPAGQPLRLTRAFTLDEGNNEIEVVAYNATNLIASVPVRATVTGPALTTAAPARLFVLAVGLNDYADTKFKLTYAVQDAKALGDALQLTGKGLYSEVKVTLVQDADARRDKIDALFTELAGKVKPTDLFVFYIAGHGKTVDGRYYFVPQDFHFDGDRTHPAEIDKAVVAQGIGQARWQTWFARIAAKKSVLLFDTCEAGTLAEDKATRALERGAANDRLAQATGRTIITASAGDKEAIEGFHDHGLFTYSVLEALERADSNGDGKIDVAEFAAYVHAQVSVLSEKVFKQRQVPQVHIISNYPFATPARVLPQAATDLVIPEKPTHQVSAEAQLLVLPAVGARQVRKLDAKTPLTLVGSEGGWSLVATHGQPIGYLATRELAPIQ